MIKRLANKVISLENKLQRKDRINKRVTDQIVQIESTISRWRNGGDAERCLAQIERIVFSDRQTSVTLPRIKTSDCEYQSF